LSDPESPKVSERLADAFAYATRLHDGQVRKGTDIPYLSHLMAVAALVQENGGDEEQVIAALLHDGPEDQGGEPILNEIQLRFGDRVAAIVAECSDTFEERKPPWLDRKRRYLEDLETASEATLLVSAADKVHNLGCITRDFRTVGDRERHAHAVISVEGSTRLRVGHRSLRCMSARICATSNGWVK